MPRCGLPKSTATGSGRFPGRPGGQRRRLHDGGSSVKGAGLLSRRAEIERLQQEARDLSEKARQAKEEVARLSQEAAAAEAALTGARGELSVAGEEKIRARGRGAPPGRAG